MRLLTVFVAIAMTSLWIASTASAHLIDSVSLNPRVETSVDTSAANSLPGESLPLTITATNAGSSLALSGRANYLGSIFTTSTVRSWYAVLEAQNSSGSWYPLAGAANAAAGYSPAGLPSITTGLAFDATPVSAYGVTYPSSGDQIIGTKLAGLTQASWNHTAVAEIDPVRLATLLSESETPQIRLRVHFEASRKGLFGSQYTDTQNQTATFGKMLRSQSGTASQIQLALASSAAAQSNFDSTSHPELAALSAGESVSIATQAAIPEIAPKSPGESDGEYLARLRAAAEAEINLGLSGSFAAAGAAAPLCWWLLFDIDPPYATASTRTLPVDPAGATIATAVPVLEIAKSGPAEVDAGTSAEYEITVINTTDAAASAEVTDEVDGQTPASLTGFGAISPGQTLTGTHAVTIPASLPGGEIHDRALVTWSDSAGNDYGPVGADFTSQLTQDTTPPEAPTLLSMPDTLTNQTTASFEFDGEDGGTFRCALDGGLAQDCTSPASVTDLQDGNHTFTVLQVDDAGNVGSVAGYAWVVDSSAPSVPELAGAPTGSTQATLASITVTGEPGATFTCSVDGAAHVPCGSPLELNGLDEGEHTVAVIQRDAAGNSSLPAAVSWVVDVTPPAAPHLDSTPALVTNQTQAGFGYTGEPGGTFECRIDQEAFAACPNPKSYEALPAGAHEFFVRQIDDAGNAGELSQFAWSIDTSAPAPPSITSAPSSPSTERAVSFAFTGEEGGSYECALDGEPFSACSSPAEYQDLPEGTHIFSVVQTDDAANRGGVATASWEIVPGGQAPPLEQNGVVPFEEQVSFIYSGPTATQQDLFPGSIDQERVAVIRGAVRERSGDPLPGARVEVLGEPAFGFTTTDADGIFSIAVNGGASVRVEISKDGYLAAVREVETIWNDYAWADDTVLVRPVTESSEIDLSTPFAQAQIAQGPVESDADGSRRATLIFNPGTQASMEVEGLGSVPLTNLRVRATELTVGQSGPDAMPAPMAPNIAYTYAAAFTVDQAQSAGAHSVVFSRPVISYTDNFLNMPTGVVVPSGYLDHDTGRWAAEPSGRVVAVLGESGGEAVLDVAGDGSAATQAQLDALEITPAELAGVAERFDAGQTFWRVPLDHFSHYDFNWGFGPPGDADNDGIPDDEECPDCEEEESASIIGVETQSLGESVGLPGTEFSLNYLSRKSRGYRAADRIDLALTKGAISQKLRSIVVETEVAGQRLTQELEPATNLKTSVLWDRKDGFGRDVNGSRIAHVKIGYTYEGVYRQTERFGYSGNGTTITGSRTRQEVTLWREHDVTVGGLDAMAAGLGGWTLDAEHYYDRATGTLYRGGANERLAGSAGLIVERVTKGAAPPLPPGYPCALPAFPALAESAYLCDSRGVAVGASGTVYLTDTANGLFSFGRDGVMRKLEGQRTITGTRCGYPNDYGWLPAHTEQIAVDSAENVYFMDEFNCVIWKRAISGEVSRVAGGGGDYAPAAGTPAQDASFYSLGDLAVGPDSTLYFTDLTNRKIFHVATDGQLEVVAGNGSSGNGTDGSMATESPLFLAQEGLAVGADSTLYFSEYAAAARVRAVAPSGKLQTIAGGPATGCSSSTASGTATSMGLGSIEGLSVLRDGSLVLADYCNGNHVMRRVDQSGLMRTLAGQSDPSKPDSGDGGSAPRHHMKAFGFDEAPDGSILIATGGSIRSVHHRRPQDVPAGAEITVAGDDDSELLVFDALGRQLRSVNAKTGWVEYSFSRDAAGRLTAITDGDANVTTFARSASGVPTSVTGPFGRVSNLETDGHGRLSAVEDQLGNRVEMDYGLNGLLSAFKVPNGATSEFTYDADGRLIHDENELGGFKHLSRSESLSAEAQVDRKEITVETAAGRERRYVLEHRPDGSQFREKTNSDGTRTQTTKTNAATSTTTDPYGTTYSSESAPDPRFGMFSPFVSAASVETPGGKKLTYAHQRSVDQSDPEDPSTLVSQTDTTAINGKTSTTTYTKASQTYASTSPAGRQISTQTDTGSRPTQVSVPGINPLSFTYDAHGRLLTTSQGTRQSSFAYEPDGDLAQITDPLGRVSSFDYDAAGRMIAEHLPGGRSISYTYDANGNVTSIAPPSRPAHNFTFNPLDQMTSSTPPQDGLFPQATTYEYATPDHDLTKITRPGGGHADYAYDSAGRLASVTDGQGQSSFGYSASTGNLTSLSSPDGENLAFIDDGSLPTAQTLTGEVAATSALTYNNDFQLASATTAGSQTTFTYDADGLRTQAGDLSLTSDPQNGLLTGLSLANTTTQISHNPYGEPEAIDTDISGSDLYRVNLTRDIAGRITTKQEIRPTATTTWAYNYDAAGRLENVLKDGAQHAAYAYDANGNRTSQTIAGQSTYAIFDARDRMRTQGLLDLTYNDNGELTSKTNRTTGESLTLSYTTLGDLKSATTAAGDQIEYLLDGAGRRVGKKVDGDLTQGLIYSPEAYGPVAELDQNNDLVARFIYGRASNVPDYMVKGSNTYRLITDQLGSVVIVANATTGAIAQEIEYGPFGEVLSDSNPGFQPFGFAGGIYDQDTGLTHFGAREYDAELGRWTASDPIGFGGGDSNLYGYVLGDPVNLVDPSGLYATYRPHLNETGQAMQNAGAAIQRVGEPVVNFVKDHPSTILAIGAGVTCVFSAGVTCTVAAVTSSIVSVYYSWRDFRTGKTCTKEFLVDLGLSVFPVGAAGTTTKILNQGMRARPPSPGIQHALRTNTQTPATGAAVTVGEGDMSCVCK